MWCSQMTKHSREVKLNEQDVRNYRPLYEKNAGCDRKQYNTLIRITDNTMKNEIIIVGENWGPSGEHNLEKPAVPL